MYLILHNSYALRLDKDDYQLCSFSYTLISYYLLHYYLSPTFYNTYVCLYGTIYLMYTLC